MRIGSRHALFNTSLQLFLAALAVLGAYQMGTAAQAVPSLVRVDPAQASVATDFALAYVSSWVFNLIVIVIPGLQRRHRVRSWLTSRYLNLKDDLVRIYLGLIGRSYDAEIVEELRNPVAFVEYFTARHSADQNCWHAVHNGLYEWGLPEIRAHCQTFVSDCDLAVGLIGELSDEAESVLGNVRYILLRANLAAPDYDDIKWLLNTLFSLHCSWSVLDGKTKDDLFLDKITRL